MRAQPVSKRARYGKAKPCLTTAGKAGAENLRRKQEVLVCYTELIPHSGGACRDRKRQLLSLRKGQHVKHHVLGRNVIRYLSLILA